MKETTQYQKDLKWIEKIDSLVSANIEHRAYFIALAACLLAHVLYLCLFAFNGIREMAIFNTFSVIFYVVCILLVRIVREKMNIIYAAMAEIIIHASYAIRCVGKRPDFEMFLLMIVPVAFLIPNKNKFIQFGFMGVSLLLYGILRFVYSDPERVLYDLEYEPIGMVLYVINILSGVFVTVYATTVATIIASYTDSKLRVQNEQLRIMASVDPLTKLGNRRAMGEHLKQVSAASLDSGRGYVIGLGDIDNFKRVNDTYGHDYGDTVLAEAAQILMNCLSESGFAARWGGEEFLFVIPESDIQDGFVCAENIVRTIRSHRFVKGDCEFFVTMTFGVCAGSPGDDVDRIISIADSRLYKGKNNGKNHTEFTD